MNVSHALSGIALAVCISPAIAADGFAAKAELETLSGTYASTAPENWYGGFATREFSFDDGNWGLSFTHALDPEMKMTTFRFRTEGPYEIGAPSEEVAVAYEGNFTEAKKYVTLLTEDPDLISAFGLADCGLTYGVETDISETGCGHWQTVAACGVDHDLFAKDSAGVYFGVRPADNDMCTPDRRPTTLLQPVVLQ